MLSWRCIASGEHACSCLFEKNYFMCTCVWPAHMSLHHVYAVLFESRRGHWVPRIGVTHGCKLHCWMKNQTWILCKNSQCFQALSHHSSLYAPLFWISTHRWNCLVAGHGRLLRSCPIVLHGEGTIVCILSKSLSALSP